MSTEALFSLTQLARDRSCTRCPLHEGVKEVSLPTTLYGPERRHDRAVLIVGEAPGATEDREGQPFVGKAGRTLKKLYIDFFKLYDLADVWLGNAVRCHPPGNKTPTKTQLKSCQGFLLADLHRLQREYTEVIVLCVGAPAVASVIGGTLRQSFHRQGDFADLRKLINGQTKYMEMAYGIPCPASQVGRSVYPEPVRTFSTYHPSYVNREPSVGLAVKAHLQMLVDYLNGKLEYEMDELLEIAKAPMPPEYPIRRLSLDIETYGIVEGYPKQTMFHPRKSEVHDHIARDSLIQTVGLSWRTPAEIHYCVDGGITPLKAELRHAIFYMDDPVHRRRLWAWLRKIQKHPEFEYLLGQNLTFDLMYLRHCYKEAKILLDHPLPIMDLMVLNYLHDESRPEKSLKALAPLFRVTKYGGEFIRYPDARDPLLAQYNCQDTGATLRLAEKLESEIRGFYGQDTKKLSPFCMEWYSQLLWLIIWMSETGICMDEPKLVDLFEKYQDALAAIIQHAEEEYGIPLQGKGSEKAKRSAMEYALHAVELCCDKVPDLRLTETKGLVSFCVENRNALMDALKGVDLQTGGAYRQLKVMGSYQDVSGLLDRYLYPMLIGRGKKHDKNDTVLIGGFAYPSWFPVPSEYEDKNTGGTKQARIVARGPAIQTFPPPVKKAITGRFPGGYMIWFDYSQIELRMAALLSNDSAMTAQYLGGSPDLHGETAKLVFGDDIVNHPRYRELYRQAGKVLNFLMLYRGGAKKFHVSLLQDVGLDYPLSKCTAAINAFRTEHRELFKWQDGLLDFVKKHGYYELPLIGQSRLFLGGRKAKEKAINEIVNLPVQALAADVTLSAQFMLWARFRREGLKAIVPCNIYDAGLIECPKHEIYRVRKIIDETLSRPAFYVALCEELGRTIPLEYEVTETRMETR